MIKPKFNLITRIKQALSKHPTLKLIALILAILIWFHIKNEMHRNAIHW
jgi:YbbR domain-containing protein